MKIEEFNELRMLKYILKNDGIMFMRYFFKLRTSQKMIVNWHHYVVQHVLDKVILGEINRLIINIPPGYTKTELCVINFIARGFALNPKSKFIHASSSASLAENNSRQIISTINLPEFNRLFFFKISEMKSGVKEWYTEETGGMIAVPAGGQVAGFRAGTMQKKMFSGAIIGDDLTKPDDVHSKIKRDKEGRRVVETFRSRLALEEIPIIIVMQRLHENDVTGFLLDGGTGDLWHHLSIPAIPKEPEKKNKYTHRIKIDINEILKELKG